MRFNILIGGKAGQGINKVSQIVSDILTEQGYFTFNYRDYPSLIRGGHNFNILSISDKRVGSYESKLDGIVAMDEKTIVLHKNELKNNGFIIDFKEFDGLGRNLNIALAGALIKIFGIDKRILIDRIKKEFNNQEAISASEKGFNNKGKKFELKKLKNSILRMSGSQGVAEGAINSKIDLYLSYPMTPATAVMHELAAKQIEHNFLVFQPENEIAVANAGLGASFAGAKTMIGSSGGGYDLMTEALSMQGISEIPLIVYLASRPGPGTGIPTYSTQADLDVALRAGHGEFPRIVIAPGDPIECTEKTNEAFYLSEKYGALSIILSDKNLAESEFSSEVAKIYNTKHHKLIVKPSDLLKSFITIADNYDEPIGDNSILPSMLVSKLASSKVKVALTGDGGDENFAGYERYLFVNISNFISKISHTNSFVPKTLGALLKLYPHKQTERSYRFLTTLNEVFYRKYINYNLFFTNSVKQNLYSQSFKKLTASNDTYELYKKFYDKDLSDLDNALKIDINTYLPDNLLYKTDTASMAFGLELRSPFLDHILMEKIAKMPSNMKLKLFTKKKILKSIAKWKNLLPQELINRPKKGFNIPQNKWPRIPNLFYIFSSIFKICNFFPFL